MKVGSDSVLLGAWTEVNNIRNVADLGAGTGILGLMLAQRAKARVTAIDIDIDATIQSAENFSNSPWPELFESVCADIHELTDVYKGVFDLAIFNPPYFEGHVIAASANRTTARHLNDESNSRLHWLKTAFEITNKEGKSSMIIPFENSQKNRYTIVVVISLLVAPPIVQSCSTTKFKNELNVIKVTHH